MIKFIVDSTFGVSKEYAEKHDIKIVNLKMILDGITTNEGFSDTWDEFYERLKNSKNFPTTSQANPYSFIEMIDEIYAKDENAEIIITTIASSLSSTYQSAVLAASEYTDKKIAVLDSRNGSVCSKMLLEELVEYSSTHNFDETVLYADEVSNKLAIYFIPDSMEYLRRGGRIGLVTSKIVDAIKMKPIFEFKNNKLSVVSKVFGLPRAIAGVIKKIPEVLKRMSLIYIYDNSHIEALMSKVTTELGITDYTIEPVDPVFGVHVGPKAFGVALLAK